MSARRADARAPRQRRLHAGGADGRAHRRAVHFARGVRARARQRPLLSARNALGQRHGQRPDRLRATARRSRTRRLLVVPEHRSEIRVVCGTPDGNWPDGLRNLASIQVSTPAVTYPALTSERSHASGHHLGRRLTLRRTCTAPRSCPPATARDLRSCPSKRARARSVASATAACPTTATMTAAFPQLRVLRIVQNGRQYYGQIVAAAGGAQPTVTINAAAARSVPLGQRDRLRLVRRGWLGRQHRHDQRRQFHSVRGAPAANGRRHCRVQKPVRQQRTTRPVKPGEPS